MKSAFTLLFLTLAFLFTGCAAKNSTPEANGEEAFAAVAERITHSNSSANSEVELSSVLFIYNRVFIPYEYRKVVRAHADFLKANPSLKVILEGNADIGGKQKAHNKIGLMRAEEVKKRLITFGVEPRRIGIATYGSDRPKVEGRTIKEWQPNRRVDFVYIDEAELGAGN